MLLNFELIFFSTNKQSWLSLFQKVAPKNKNSEIQNLIGLNVQKQDSLKILPVDMSSRKIYVTRSQESGYYLVINEKMNPHLNVLQSWPNQSQYKMWLHLLLHSKLTLFSILLSLSQSNLFEKQLKMSQIVKFKVYQYWVFKTNKHCQLCFLEQKCIWNV